LPLECYSIYIFKPVNTVCLYQYTYYTPGL